MSELLIPERALLLPSRPEESESNARANNFNPWFSEPRNQHHYNSFWIQKVLSFFVLELPSLPIANARDTRNSRIGENIPLRYLSWTSQRDRPDRRTSFNRQNSHEGRDPHGKRVEERRPSFESEFIVKDGRETAHNARKEALAQQLQPMLGDDADALVLLCWGEKYHCSIIPVRVSDPADEAATWRDIGQAWYSRRGCWRRYLPFFGVEHVDIVEVCPRAWELPPFIGLTNISSFRSQA